MLDNPDYINISSDNHKWEKKLKFMLELCVYVIISLTLVNLEVIANIQSHISTSKTQLYNI